jgi:hypothetical protein
VEESRSNLLTYSDISTSWDTIGGTVSQDGQLSPDGIFQSYKYIPNTNNDFKGVTKSGILTSSGSSYTVSVFVKDGGYDNLVIFIDNVTGSGGRVGALFNLSTKQITVGGLNTSGYSYNYGIIDFNNCWYRIYITTEVNASSISLTYRFTNNAVGYVNTTGDGTSGIYIWGAQLEQGAFPTSYIPTEGSTRTRAADDASITGRNFSEWYRQDEGTLVTEVTTATIATTGADWVRFVNVSGNTDVIRLTRSGSGQTPQLLVTKNNVGQTGPFTTGVQPNIFSKLGFYYKTNDFGITRNGSALTGSTISTTGEVPTVDRMLISNPPVNGYIKRLTYYPKRLPDAQLQALTR